MFDPDDPAGMALEKAIAEFKADGLTITDLKHCIDVVWLLVPPADRPVEKP